MKEDALAEFGERQAGVVTRSQLTNSGLSVKDIKVRVGRGSLRPTAGRGVYRVAGAERTWRQDLWIAVLAGPEGTLASHSSAAALRGLSAPPAVPHVTVPRNASGRFQGAVIHHAAITPRDRSLCGGIGTTVMGRTLVDCAPILPQKGLNTLTDAASGQRLCSYRNVMEAWERAGPVRGGGRIQQALPRTRPAPNRAASRRLTSSGGSPAGTFLCRCANTRSGMTMAAGWPRWTSPGRRGQLILEYDGDAGHGPRRWGADATRQALVEALGWRVAGGDRFDLRPSATRLFDLLTGILTAPPWAA